jgi:uncharacterized membrane-anchored protein YhcB (DUF1043 family)
MKRKILSGTLITFSSIMLILCLVGIGVIWINKKSLTQTAVSQLQAVDKEMEQAQSAFEDAKLELERTRRLVESTEASMEILKNDFSQIKTLLDSTNGILGNTLLPGLESTRDKIDKATGTLQDLRDTLAEINSIPFLDLNLPGDELLANLIDSADSLDTQIVNIEDLVNNASTFLSDASYLMGADFSETKAVLENFLSIVTEYEQKILGWRAQIASLLESLPGWITAASICLTVLLVWFGFSQVSLILHGLTAWQGDDPLTGLRSLRHPR